MLKILTKPLFGYESEYNICEDGTIIKINPWRLQEGGIVKANICEKGYVYVNLFKNGKHKRHRLHRLMAQTFIPNPNNLPEVNHKDEIKTNNKIDNLEWCDRKYNNNYGTRTKRATTHCIGNNYNRKVSIEDDVPKFIQLYDSGLNYSDIGHIMGFSRRTVSNYIKKYVGEDEV